MFRRRRSEPTDPLAAIDPAAVPRRFATPVRDAVEARRNYQSLIAGLRPGPVKDRLAALTADIDRGITSVWDTVQRAAELERILATLDPERVTAEYKQAKRGDASSPEATAHAQRFASVQRLLNALDDTDERLRLLNTRLGAAVAHAAEVALAAGAGADELDAELTGVVDDLAALRAGLDDLS